MNKLFLKIKWILQIVLTVLDLVEKTPPPKTTPTRHTVADRDGGKGA